jgi:FAD-linked oxidoreductase
MSMNLDRINIDRRKLLKLAGASMASAGIASATGVLGGCADKSSEAPVLTKGIIGENGKRVLPWSNWSGLQHCQPSLRVAPASEAELAQMIGQSKQAIRFVGSGHSFNALVPTDQTLMSLARLRGIESIDASTRQANIWAGTTLAELGEPLWENGMSIANMPDIDKQALAGAIATSTHGAGERFGSLSSMVTQMRLVNARGEIIECSADKNSDLFNAARTNMGALGAVSQIKLQLAAALKLKRRQWIMPFEEVMERIEELRANNRNFEFFALPHTDYVFAITHNETDEETTIHSRYAAEDSYETFRMMSKVYDWVPGFMRHRLGNMAAGTVEPEEEVARAFEIFSNTRDIRNNEMEYSLPAELAPACIREMMDVIRKENINIVFPIEYRYVKADDIWLSPFYQRTTCSISVHQFIDRDYRPYFARMEEILRKYEGRPHPGKLHSLSHKELSMLYPRFQDFLQIRKEMDPEGKFLNDFLRKLLGVV